jgi:FkbM family methyltransferase
MGSYYEHISAKTKFLNTFRKILAGPAIDPILAFLMRKLPILKKLTGKIIPPEYLYKKPSLRNYSVNGIRMELDISNLVDHFIYFSFEHRAISNFVKELKAGDTVLDVGANIGYTTLLFGKKCKEGRVLSFEPSKQLFHTLTQHVQLNALTNVEPINLGLGEKESTAKLFVVDKFNTGMNRILEQTDEDIPCESISIKKLDDIINSKGLQKVNAIKIDVEGFEYKVLQGAISTLTRMRPVMMIEVNDRNLKQQNSSRQELFSFLKDLNYKAFDAETMKEIDLTGDYPLPHFDILCFPKN